MAENTPSDNRFYAPQTLLKWFGIASIAMLITTFWMILDDFGRSWKVYQREFASLKVEKYKALLEQAKTQVDGQKLSELQAALKASEAERETKKGEIERIQKEIVLSTTQDKIATNRYQTAKAQWDVWKYEYEAKHGHKYAAGFSEGLSAEGQKALEKLNKEFEKVSEFKNIANIASQKLIDKKAELNNLLAAEAKIKKEIKLATFEIDRLTSAAKEAKIGLVELVRNAPIVDMANPVFRVEQIVLPHIRDDINFANVQKVDRCTTCHQGIALKGFEDAPQPFRTHPKLDVMLGSTSPHPIDKIGCTVCHDGRGQAVDFVRSGHVPRNETQAKDWEKKYGWNEAKLHHIEEKMLPLQYTEGKCLVCHQQTEFVPRAEKLNAAIQLVRGAGCYGCHAISGWEHVRKPAPSLKKIKGKLTRDWLVKWIRDPNSFNPHARMPKVFHLSNMETEEQKAFQDSEVSAIAEFLLSASENYTPNVSLALGSTERGKALFNEKGCLGCHQIDDFRSPSRTRYGFAPDLSTVGSKVTQDWLSSWLKNPRHYWDKTTMPSFRLSDSQISDLSAYLLSKKNPDFEKAVFLSPSEEVQRKLLTEYLMSDTKYFPQTVEKISGVMSKFSSRDVSLQLGERAMNRYGCYGCHEVKGYETTQGIGTELTEEGSKQVKKLDFGLLHLPHTNHAWFHKKLEDSRIFDKGIVKKYLDLLRMPQFYFTEEERELLVLYLLGRTAQKLGPSATKVLSAREAKIEEGMRVIRHYNCQGCHVIEGLYNALPEDHPKFEEHQKYKNRLEGRILSYYEEDETLGPPSLWGEGKKIKTDWVFGFIKNPIPLRKRLQVTMPTFQMSNDEINKIATAFAHDGQVEFPIVEESRIVLTSQELSDARVLFNKLQCLNCHVAGENLTPAQAMEGSRGLAPDFWLSHQRLHMNWLKDWLKDPQVLMPGTRMPGFWPEGQSPVPEVLGGDATKQIELVAKYVYYIGQNKTR